jgi:hypothetical protein
MWKAWLFRSWKLEVFVIRLRSYFDRQTCVSRMPPFWLTAADSHDGFAEQLRQFSANCASAERLHNLQNPRHIDAYAAINGQRIILYHTVICWLVIAKELPLNKQYYCHLFKSHTPAAPPPMVVWVAANMVTTSECFLISQLEDIPIVFLMAECY